MSNYPETADIFIDRTGADYIASSDPNVAYDGIEAIEGFVGSLGKPQSWSETLVSVTRKYRRGLELYLASGIPKVKTGEIVLEDTNGAKYCYRKNTAEITMVESMLDAGVLITTYYYVYAWASSASGTAGIKFSSNPVVPDGIGTNPYYMIGWLYNTAGATLTASHAGNIKDGNDVPNVIECSAISYESCYSASGTDIPRLLAPFYSNGRPIKVVLSINTKSAYMVEFNILVDGNEKRPGYCQSNTAEATTTHVEWKGFDIDAGCHTIKAQWQSAGPNLVYTGETTGTMGARYLWAEEM